MFIMSSSEVSIVAIVKPNPGKLERVRVHRPVERSHRLTDPKLKEVISKAIEWIRDNEPDTLEFSLYECASEDGVQLSMVEK